MIYVAGCLAKEKRKEGLRDYDDHYVRVVNELKGGKERLASIVGNVDLPSAWVGWVSVEVILR
jgi:hypothetical protein